MKVHNEEYGQIGGQVSDVARSETSVACVACGGSRWVFAREGFDHYRPNAGNFRLELCSNCGNVMQIPQPTGEQLREAYSIEYLCYRPAWKQPGWPVWKILRRITTWRRMRRLKRLKGGKNLLEVGSGAGDFLYAAHRTGWKVCGIEYSKECADELRSETGIDVKAGELVPGLWEAGTFDVVALWNVVEHLPAPLDTLKIVAGYLRKGGAVLVQLPTCDCVHLGRAFGPHWELLDLPRHLNFFSRQSLARLFGESGLELVEFTTPIVDLGWCYVASTRNCAALSQNKVWRTLRFGWGMILVLLMLPWLALRAWRGRGTEVFAVAIKK